MLRGVFLTGVLFLWLVLCFSFFCRVMCFGIGVSSLCDLCDLCDFCDLCDLCDLCGSSVSFFGVLSSSVPKTLSEIIFCTFVIVAGATMFGYVVGNISTMVGSFNMGEKLATDLLQEIRNYLREQRITRQLSMEVLNYFENYLEYKTAFNENASKCSSCCVCLNGRQLEFHLDHTSHTFCCFVLCF